MTAPRRNRSGEPAADRAARPGLLNGVTIVDLAGSNGLLAGRLAAELGATVILVEPAGGHPSRFAGPWPDDAHSIETSLTFAALNSGKLSLTLDPGRDDAAAQLAGLLESADVVITSNETPWASVDLEGLPARGISVVEVQGFAESGPYASYRAPEIVTTALGGLLYISGDAARPPCMPPEPLGQYFAGVWAGLALVSAVWRQRTQGVAASYRIAAHEALATVEHLIRAAAMDGEPITRNGSQHKSVAPARVFPSRDGFVYIYVSRNHWLAFLAAWQPHPEEFDDPKWLPNSARRAASRQLNPAVAAWTREYDTVSLVELLQGAGVPCLPVNRPSQFPDDRQVVARELFAAVEHPALGTFRQLRFPALIDGVRPAPSIPPTLGEHADRFATLAREPAPGAAEGRGRP